jgi:Rrf2 family protein
MRSDSRLSTVLHVLLHMADADRPVTSEELALRCGGNAAVMRRMMAGLREAGLLTSTKGHGGGWALARPLAEMSLAGIYAALGMPTLFAMANRSERPTCLVEQAVNRAMSSAFDAAEALIVARFREVTLADVAADVKRRSSRRKGAKHVV